MKRLAQLRAEAIKLRATRHLSINEIAETLGISKGTVFYWVKHISIPKTVSARQKANQQAGTAAMQAKCAARRQEAYDSVFSRASEWLSEVEIRDFVILYLTEGYRKDRNVVSLSNSNPTMIKFAHRCMRRLATNPHFRYSFQFHSDQNPEELKEFWASYLDISPGLIKPMPKTNSGQLKGRRFACQYGVFLIQVSDTMFRARLQALMDVVQEQWAGSASDKVGIEAV